MFSALGSSALNLEIAHAVVESSRLFLATRSWPANFWSINSRVIRNAAPEWCARAWARRSLASEERTGPVVARIEPWRSNMAKLAFWSASQRSAASDTKPSEPMTTNLLSPWPTRASLILRRSGPIPSSISRWPDCMRTLIPKPVSARTPVLPMGDLR